MKTVIDVAHKPLAPDSTNHVLVGVPTDPVVTLRFKRDKRHATVAKVEEFLHGLTFRVHKRTCELQVLSVYLDDDGAICIDVEEMFATSAAVNH